MLKYGYFSCRVGVISDIADALTSENPHTHVHTEENPFICNAKGQDRSMPVLKAILPHKIHLETKFLEDQCCIDQ